MHSSSLDGLLKWKKPLVDTLFPLDDQQRVLKGVEEVEMDARGGWALPELEVSTILPINFAFIIITSDAVKRLENYVSE